MTQDWMRSSQYSQAPSWIEGCAESWPHAFCVPANGSQKTVCEEGSAEGDIQLISLETSLTSPVLGNRQ